MHTFANNIRHFRMSAGMTQTQLAEALGIQFQTVSKWERQIALPDTALLPALARQFGVSIDSLFRKPRWECTGDMPEEESSFLLETYTKAYGPEAGPWNLSLENKYLSYMFTKFFEDNFPVKQGDNICNIGIGAGEWDRYLSYRLRGGSLTSIDKLEICCSQLKSRWHLEENPNQINVIFADAMTLDLENAFDILTMVGTTGIESDDALALLQKAASFVKNGGFLYYQTLDGNDACGETIQMAVSCGLMIQNMLQDLSHGLTAHYYCFKKSEQI